MKGRGVNGGGVPADLMVCFPSRARLKLMPKPICSPSRPQDTACKRPAAGGRSQASPLSKTEIGHDDEPSSPKVTCAGQIKVSRPKCRSTATTAAAAAGGRSSSRNWLTVALKKDVMQFLGAGFRGLRFPSGSCFGSFSGPVGCISDDDGDEEEEEGEGEEAAEERVEMERNDSKTIFSKWFMVLEENRGLEFKNNKEDEEENDEYEERIESFHESTDAESLPAGPPANALLLMRCRSAPAKGWLKRRESEEEGEEKPKWSEKEEKLQIKEEEREKKKERSLVSMSYECSDYFKISTDIVKETWIVGCVDPMARSRSLKT